MVGGGSGVWGVEGAGADHLPYTTQSTFQCIAYGALRQFPCRGRVTNAVGTIFRKIFVGTRASPI